MKFNDKLTNYRKRANMSQIRLCIRLGVSRQSVFKWERGYNYPSVDKICLLCEILDVCPDDLLLDGEYNENSRYTPKKWTLSPESIGKNIKKHRKLMNLSQQKLSEALSVTRQTVSRWETGAIAPELVSMVDTAQYFGISLNELFCRS